MTQKTITFYWPTCKCHLIVHDCLKRAFLLHRINLLSSKRRKKREKYPLQPVSLDRLNISHLGHKDRACIVTAFSGSKVFWPKAKKQINQKGKRS